MATAGDCYFDVSAADAAIAFFHEQLTHIEGALAGQPLDLEPWQQAIIGCAFGWKRPDGMRRYREVFQYVPRKNGKSTMAGGLVNLVAYCDGEPGAQIYCAAAEREQASLVYRQTKGMILQNSLLEQGTRIYNSFKSIEFPDGSVFKALSADADTKHGFNTHFNVIDELHAHHSRDLVDVLMTSTGSRRQPMTWHITTADFDRESICNEKYDYACKIRDQVVNDPAFLPVVFEAAVDDDWRDPAIWRKANPNLGISVGEEYLRRECQRAQEVPGYENTFKRLHLNIRTQNDVRWLSLESWDGCDAHATPPSLESIEQKLAGRRCFAGLDLSSKLDITAFVLLFPPEDEEEGQWHVLPRFFIPEDGARQRERTDRVPYITWASQGFVKMTPGNVVDYEVVKHQINEDARRFEIQEIAYDGWNATQIALQLQDAGATMVEFGQGYRSMSEPTKEFEKLVVSGRLKHAANPVLRWMASHVSAESDPAGNIKPSKKKSPERIDGIVATVMALGRALVAGDPGSVYDSRDLIIL